MKQLALSSLLVLSLSGNAIAGLYSSSFDSRSSVVASVEIEGKGIYNLVVSVQFLHRPYDRREYSSDEYEELINRLSVSWRGVALRKVLENNTYRVADLAALETAVESEIDKLIELSRQQYGISRTTEVVYSVSGFYLVEPETN